MRPSSIVVAAAIGAGVLGISARAQADEPVAVLPSPAATFFYGEPPPDDVLPRLTDRTALTLGAGKLELGILAFEYNPTNWLSFGISPPYWAIRSVANILVPNLHFKVVGYRSQNLWLAANVAGYYAFVGNGNQAKGNLLTVPISLFASVQAVPRFWIHGEFTYNFVQAFGSGDFKSMTLDGTASTRTVQLGLMLQYQLTRVVSLTLFGRYEPYTGTVAVSGSGGVDTSTTATVDARITPGILHPWEVVPGVALGWTHVRLILGAGYGHYFLPGMDIAIRGAGFVPEGSLYFVL
jgi:hypothetical protein